MIAAHSSIIFEKGKSVIDQVIKLIDESTSDTLISMMTNGLLLDESIVKTLKDSGLAGLQRKSAY